MKEKENRLKREEQERNSRIDKWNSLKGIWELMRTCKEYPAEIDWRVGNEKNEERKAQRESIEKEIRFKKIKENKFNFEKR